MYNEIKSFLVNRGAMLARDRFAAAVCAAVQIRRCQSTASRPVRALTASFFRVRRALSKQKTFPWLHQQIVRKAHMVARGGAVEQRHLGEAEAALIDAYTINVWIAAA